MLGDGWVRKKPVEYGLQSIRPLDSDKTVEVAFDDRKSHNRRQYHSSIEQVMVVLCACAAFSRCATVKAITAKRVSPISGVPGCTRLACAILAALSHRQFHSEPKISARPNDIFCLTRARI